LDGKNKILDIYFDFQKAFDTVDHQILLNKLYHVGVRGIMHNWLKNYISKRKQFKPKVCNGVPSVIGDIVS